MTHAALAPGIGREFDPFLFASVGEGRHGHPLTVISALAQSDVDPWLEAVGLTRLSREMATARLSKLISALSGQLATNRPVNSIAEELVALLPRANWVPPLAQAKPILRRAAAVSPKLRLGLGAGFTALMIALFFLFSSHNLPDRAPKGMPQATDDEGAAGLSPAGTARRP
jgi:hypothetical protein